MLLNKALITMMPKAALCFVCGWLKSSFQQAREVGKAPNLQGWEGALLGALCCSLCCEIG